MESVSSDLHELDLYRADADRFLAELEEETYRHYAGLKDSLELAPIYERHEGLATLETCADLRAEAERARAPRAGPVELWRFACEGYVGRLAREQTERVAELETTLAAELDGERVGYRLLEPVLANEPDRARRERIDRARAGLTEELNTPRAEALGLAHGAARELAGGTYRELYERFGFALEPLAAQCERFLADTEELYVESFGRLLQARLGLDLAEARRWDVPRIFRAPEWDDAFRADRMLPALVGTLGDLGIDLDRQPNVHLDVERRDTKSPRAFCAPIEVPGRVVLVIQPIGGLDDWRALFHEAGHTEHFAHVSARLPFEARRLGDNAVTEGWAFLLEHLVTDPVWLTRRLDCGRPEELARESAATRLWLVRRHCAKLLYELELHASGDLGRLRALYAERMEDATKIAYAPADFLADVDPGFYVASYLRAWALEAVLARHLRERFGRAWFAERKAGSLLRELWSEGQGMDADELAREVTGASLDLAAVAEAIRASL